MYEYVTEGIEEDDKCVREIRYNSIVPRANQRGTSGTHWFPRVSLGFEFNEWSTEYSFLQPELGNRIISRMGVEWSGVEELG